MENPTPFDLNEAVRRWQQNLGASPAFGADNLEELASHLRAAARKLQAAGLSEEEAFLIATRRIGERRALELEYAKVKPAGCGSLPLVSFWVVTGLYLLQAVSSLVFGLLSLRQLMEQRGLRRLIAGGADIGFVMNHVSSFYYLPRSFAPMMSIIVALLSVLGVRLAAGSYAGFGAFLRSFQRPIRTALGLVALGLVASLLPDVLASFLTPEKIVVPPSFNGVYGLFLFGYFETHFAVPLAGYAAGQAVIYGVLVSTMVWLARRALRQNGAAPA